MSKRKEPSSPNEAIRESARIAFEDEESALRSEIRTMKRKHARFAEEKATFETKLRAEKRMFMRKWSLEAEPVEKALAEAQGRLDRLREKEEERRHHLSPDENASRLDKLPPELWDKVLDNLDENDLFPLALSCRYFRQKQKEQVARTRQQEPVSGKSPLALKTTFRRNLFPAKLVWPGPGPASADYLRFCSKEKVSLQQYYGDEDEKRLTCLRVMAAYRGYLPLLQELTKTSEDWYYEREIADSANDVIWCAGESSSSQFLLLLGSASDCFLHFTVRGGQLETVRWLKTQDYHGLDGRLFRETCESGNLEMMKWLRSEGCLWDARAYAGAASGGHLEALKWLRSEGCP